MIDSKDISVVVQGAISKKETPKCLKSIRKFLPDAQIILSTWEGSNVEGLDYDVLILNKDPGAVFIGEMAGSKLYNNVNRQLLSTKEGLKKAERKYAMKLRSDLILTSNKFLEYFDKFQKRGASYNLFERKLLASAVFTRYSIEYIKENRRDLIPFHISDWWFFGLKSDLDKYFMDTPLVEEPNFTNYFALEENKNKYTPYYFARFKFAPEQYFGYECFSRNFADIHMEDASSVNDEIMNKYRQCLVNNFIILEYKQSGIYLNKYTYSRREKFIGEQYFGLYNMFRYESEYKEFCDSDYKVCTNDICFKSPEYGIDFSRICKHLYMLSVPTLPLRVRLEQLFISIPVTTFLFFVKHFKEIIKK